MKSRCILAGLLGLSLFSGAAARPVHAAEPDEDTKAVAERLLQRARDLKAEGRLDESAELAVRAKQLQQQLRADLLAQGEPRTAPPADGERAELPPNDQREWHAERGAARRSDPTARIWETPTTGIQRRMEDQEALRRFGAPRAGELPPRREQEPHESPTWDRPERRENQGTLEAPRRSREPQARPSGAADPRQRLEHLRQAIRHLHAAGLPEAAERIQQEAQRMRTQLERQREETRGALGPDRAIEDLKADLTQLRSRVRALERDLEETRNQLRHRLPEGR